MTRNHKFYLFLILGIFLSTLSVAYSQSYENDLVSKIENCKEEGNSYFALSYEYACFLTDSRDEKAEAILVALIEKSKENNQWRYWIKATILKDKLTEFNFSREDRSAAFDEILKHPEVQASPQLKALAYLGQGEVILSLYDTETKGDLEEALRLFRIAYQSLVVDYPEEATQALLRIVSCNNIVGKHKKALEISESGYELAKRSGNKALIGKNLYGTAFIAELLNQSKKAIEASLEALEYLEPGKDDRYLSAVYRVLADLASNNEEGEKAIEYSRIAVNYIQAINDPRSEADCLYALISALIHTEGAASTEVDSLNSKYLEIAEEYDFNASKIRHYIVKGWIFEQRGSAEKAMNTYLKTLQLIETTGLTDNKAWVLDYLSALMRKENIQFDEPADSLLTYFESVTKSDEGTLFNKGGLSSALKNIYLSEGNFERAFEFSEKQMEYKSKIWEQQHSYSLTEHKLKLENEVKEQEITFQKEQLRQKNFIQKLLIALVVSILAFALNIFYYFKKQKQSSRKIKKQNIELEGKQVEINKLVEEVKEKNKLLQRQLELKQRELIDYSVFREKRNKEIIAIGKLTEDLIIKEKVNIVDLKVLQEKQKRLASNNENYVLRHRIESLYPGFFEKLNLLHSDLSKGDVNHCAYILIGLSIKQVAELLFISPKTVQSARYRAKQKLNIGNDIRLKDYLVSILKE